MFTNKQYLKFVENCKKKSLDIVVASVSDTLGSTYTKTGNMMFINSNGEFIGVLGGSFLHNQILVLSQKAIKNQNIENFELLPLDDNSGHGTSKYIIEPFYFVNNYKNLDKYIQKAFSLLIFGSGAHVSSLVKMANLMAWKTTVIDIKINQEFVKEADELIELKNTEDIETIDLSSYNASVILSHNPKTDDIYLKALLDTPPKINYIGVMGNKKNMQRKKEKFALENEHRFFAPIGLDIGSYTSESIALSICAQIEAKANGKI